MKLIADTVGVGCGVTIFALTVGGEINRKRPFSKLFWDQHAVRPMLLSGLDCSEFDFGNISKHRSVILSCLFHAECLSYFVFRSSVQSLNKLRLKQNVCTISFNTN